MEREFSFFKEITGISGKIRSVDEPARSSYNVIIASVLLTCKL